MVIMNLCLRLDQKLISRESGGHRDIWIRFDSFPYFVISKHGLAVSEIIKSIHPPPRPSLAAYMRGEIYLTLLILYI